MPKGKSKQKTPAPAPKPSSDKTPSKTKPKRQKAHTPRQASPSDQQPQAREHEPSSVPAPASPSEQLAADASQLNLGPLERIGAALQSPSGQLAPLPSDTGPVAKSGTGGLVSAGVSTPAAGGLIPHSAASAVVPSRLSLQFSSTSKPSRSLSLSLPSCFTEGTEIPATPTVRPRPAAPTVYERLTEVVPVRQHSRLREILAMFQSPTTPVDIPLTLQEVTDQIAHLHSLIAQSKKAQERFDTEFGYVEAVNSSVFSSPCRNRNQKSGCFECSRSQIWNKVTSFVPILGWLPKYKWQTDLVPDIVAGLTVGIMNVPQGMAYGMLCGLKPVYGLYSSLYPALFYAIFGTSRHIAVGTFAVISLMVQSALRNVKPPDAQPTLPAPSPDPTSSLLTSREGRLIPLAMAMPHAALSIGNNSFMAAAAAAAEGVEDADDALLVEASMALTMLVGLFMLLFGVLRMGFISSYLSDMLVQGLTTGAACHVFSSQVPALLGLPKIESTGQPGGLVLFYIDVFKSIPSSNWVTAVMSIVCIVILYVHREWFNPWFRRKTKFPFPMELFIVIVTTGLSYGLKLKEKAHVQVVGSIPTGLRPPEIPNFNLMVDLIPQAVPIAIVTFSISMSMSKIFATKHEYRIKSNQEWLAYGFLHSLSSFFGCHAVGCSLSRSVVQDSQGGKTQLASLVNCGVILLVLLALAGLFEALPKCALAAIIVVALKSMFLQVKELIPLWRQSKLDFLIWVVGCVAVIFLDVSYGLLAGVIFAIATVIYRSQWPDERCMGRIEGTNIFRVLSAYDKAKEVPGVKVFRFDAPLYFANIDRFKRKLYETTGVDPLIEKARQRKLQGLGKPNSQLCSRRRKAAADADDNSKSDLDSPPASLEAGTLASPTGVHHIVLDCSSFPYIDMMGVRGLRDVYLSYQEVGVTVLLAKCKIAVRQMFQRSGFYDSVPKDRLYISVCDAVYFAEHCTYPDFSPGSLPAVDSVNALHPNYTSLPPDSPSHLASAVNNHTIHDGNIQ